MPAAVSTALAWRFVVRRVPALPALLCTLTAATSLAAAQVQGVPPAIPQVPGVSQPDPLILKLEEELKQLRHLETVTEDLRSREQLLARIIRLCIDLGRECPSYEQKLASVRAEMAKQVERDRMAKMNAADNELHKKRARDALWANDLAAASRHAQSALNINNKDAETLELAGQITQAQTRQLYRRIAMVVMATIVVLAVLIPVLKNRGSGVKVRALEMLEGPSPGDVFELQKEKTSLGAVASEADIVISDPFHKISRRHCEISRSGKHYFLIDCSTNGTSVNGKPVPSGEAILLKKGDRIGLADEVVLRFR